MKVSQTDNEDKRLNKPHYIMGPYFYEGYSGDTWSDLLRSPRRELKLRLFWQFVTVGLFSFVGGYFVYAGANAQQFAILICGALFIVIALSLLYQALVLTRYLVS